MSQTLTLEIEDDLYEALRHAANEADRTPEEMGAEWLANAVRRVMDDPLYELAGAIDSDTPDWADRHDHYIGQTLAEGLDGGAKRHDG